LSKSLENIKKEEVTNIIKGTTILNEMNKDKSAERKHDEDVTTSSSSKEDH